jgi:hypothetical protein
MSAIVIARTVLDEARRFFEVRGTRGCEGTALIARRADGTTRLVIPDQRASTGRACWVEITEQGKLELALAVGKDERYAARIHSHPGAAFHSEMDNCNAVITHQGALSIVVPYFGLGLRRGFDACAVYVLRGDEWVELAPGPAREAYVKVR